MPEPPKHRRQSSQERNDAASGKHPFTGVGKKNFSSGSYNQIPSSDLGNLRKGGQDGDFLRSIVASK